MALGKAFIEVHADTAPFARELASELNKIVKASEKNVKVSASKLGETIAKDTGKGIEKNKNHIGQSVVKAVTSGFGSDLFIKFTKGIIDSIDDGLSGLPAEVKVALGIALAAILPFIAGAVTALVNTTVVGAFGALGFVIGAQFQAVRDQWQILADQLTPVFQHIGSLFVGPVLESFDLIRNRVFDLEGWFRQVFGAAAGFVVPLTDALLSLVEGLLPGLTETLGNAGGIVGNLSGAFRNLGLVIGEALAIISGTDYADDALEDLVLVIGSAVLAAAGFVRVLTEVYGRLRDVSLLLGGPGGIAEFVRRQALDAGAEQARNMASANGYWADSLGELAGGLEVQAEKIKDLNQQISNLQRLTLAQINNEIAWEQAIDDLRDSVAENGRTLKISEQAGRDNANALINLANVALKTREDQIKMGISSDIAQASFYRQRDAIYALAGQMKLSKTDTDKLVGALLSIPPPTATGVDQASITRLQSLLYYLNQIAAAPGFGAIFGAAFDLAKKAKAYASGGIVDSPHLGLVGEAGPEAIIPLNNPARAQQLMSQSGLDRMGGTNVNVYIGNQQIDAYIDNRVDRRMAATARELAYGSRGI